MRKTLAVGTAVATGGAVWLMSNPAGRALGETVSKMVGGQGNRWMVVTVNCPPERFTAGGSELPLPISRLGDRAEVRIQPAPQGRGTEIGLRLASPPPAGLAGFLARMDGSDPRQELRLALRDAKSLIETGEVIKPDEPGSARPTASGKVFDIALRLAGGEGRL